MDCLKRYNTVYLFQHMFLHTLWEPLLHSQQCYKQTKNNNVRLINTKLASSLHAFEVCPKLIIYLLSSF